MIKLITSCKSESRFPEVAGWMMGISCVFCWPSTCACGHGCGIHREKLGYNIGDNQMQTVTVLLGIYNDGGYCSDE
jgi:hypothetical protein